MRQLAAAALVVAIVGVASLAQAAENPTGTWKWTVKYNDQTREMSVTLKLDGDKLTGTIPGRDGATTPIADGKFKDGEVSFTVTRERDGNKMVFKYSGKITGDTLKGKAEFTRDGNTQSRDWEAKRAK